MFGILSTHEMHTALRQSKRLLESPENQLHLENPAFNQPCAQILLQAKRLWGVEPNISPRHMWTHAAPPPPTHMGIAHIPYVPLAAAPPRNENADSAHAKSIAIIRALNTTLLEVFYGTKDLHTEINNPASLLYRSLSHHRDTSTRFFNRFFEIQTDSLSACLHPEDLTADATHILLHTPWRDIDIQRPTPEEEALMARNPGGTLPIEMTVAGETGATS